MNSIDHNYRDLLKTELSSRQLINESYSLRAFARDIGISPSSLSLILSGEQGLSYLKAKKIAINIGMTEDQQNLFCDLVLSLHGRSRKEREEATERIKIRKKEESNVVPLSVFSIVSDWYHYAILELAELKTFKNSLKWMSQKLGIKEQDVKSALERLKNVGMISQKGKEIIVETDFAFAPKDVPSQAVKKYHKQMLTKAMSSLDKDSVEQRDFSSITLAFDTEQMEEAKKDIQKFRRDFMQKYSKSDEKKSVYSLNIQFLDLLNKEQS